MGCAETRYERPSPTRFTDAVALDDLFAVGSLFFEILSGKRTYDDIDSGTVERRYKSHEFPSLDSIDHDYAKIIDKCWHGLYSYIQEIEPASR